MTQKNKKIRIGIYGASGAGKTAFIHRFMREIAEKQIGSFNERGKRFFAEITRQLEQGDFTETSESIEKIAVYIYNRQNGRVLIPTLADDVALTIVFFDASGKDLAQDLDSLGVVSGAPVNGQMKKRIKKCDAFLFLVNPIPNSSESGADHLRREGVRAEKFIREVVAQRGNNYLPILFVQTHNDLLEQASPELKRCADQWFDTVYRELNRRYKIFAGLVPGALVSPERIFCRTCATEDFDKVFQPIARLLTIEEECARAINRDLVRVRRCIAIVLLACFLIVASLIILHKQDRELPLPPAPVSEIATLAETLSNLTEFEEQSPDFRLNLKKAWLKLKSSSDSVPSEDHKKLLTALNQNLMKIDATLTNGSISERLKAAEQISDFFVASEDDPILKMFSFDKTRQKILDLGQSYALQQIRITALRNQNAKSQPKDAIGDLLETLNMVETRLGRIGIVSGEQPEPLIESIQSLAAFLKARDKSLNYETSFSIAGLSEKQTIIAFRFLDQIESDSLQLRIANADKENLFSIKSDMTNRALVVKKGNSELDIREWNTEKKEWVVLNFDRKITLQNANLAFLGMGLLVQNEETVKVTLSLENEKKCDLTIKILPVYQESLRLLWQALEKNAPQNTNP